MIKKRHTTTRVPRRGTKKKQSFKTVTRGVKEKAQAIYEAVTHMGQEKITSLEQLFIEQLKDLYSAETQLVDALPKMAKAAHAAELRKGFLTHLEQTKVHAQRLEEILSRYEESPTGKTCKAMQGLVEEGSETISENATPEVKDAALIAAAQRVEHYEIAGYGTVRTYAQLLGDRAAASLLQETLEEEAATDEKLTAASRKLNVKPPRTQKD
ncbi:MAG: ferritin-like domain-containing protein [Verrucomicrobium sp.]|nr:ferritin-like domain-containing protein [Verrucomicrobium sp.]